MRISLSVATLSLILLTACARQPVADPVAPASAASNPAATQTGMIEVSTAATIERTLARAIEITGTLEAQEEVTVSSEVEGKIAELYVDIGSFVKAGDKLLALETAELQERVKQAEASVAVAEAHLGPVGGEAVPLERHPEFRHAQATYLQTKADFERAQRLFDSGDISRQERDRANTQFEQARAIFEATHAKIDIYHANLKQARAQLALARKQLNDAVVRAPVSGAIKERLTATGEYLTKGRNVVRIVQIDPLRLRGDVPEQHIGKVQAGQMVEFTVDNLPGATFQGRITRFSPVLDKRSRTLMVEAAVRNDQLQLKPGLFARARISTVAGAAALMVPQRAITTFAGLNKVFLLVEGKAVARTVKLGQRDGDLVEVLEGVSANDQVITDNLDKLSDGQAVRSSTTKD